MRTSEKTNNILAALCAFQGQLPTMPKDKNGYGYRYTDLDTIVSTIKPILSKNGLGFMQPISTAENGNLILTTRIFNKDGEFIETDVTLQSVQGKQMNTVQQLGAGVTYMRRYALCTMLGITSDEDVDGEIRNEGQPARKEEPKKPEQKPQQKQTPKKPILAGGEATKEEQEAIKKLFASTYPDGTGVFTIEEKKAFTNLRSTKTAAEVITIVTEELNKRVKGAQNPDPTDLY